MGSSGGPLIFEPFDTYSGLTFFKQFSLCALHINFNKMHKYICMHIMILYI